MDSWVDWVRWRWSPVLLFVLLWTVYVATMDFDRPAIDPVANELNAQVLALTGHPWLEHSAVTPPEGWPIPFAQQTPSGHTVATRTPGQVLWAVPFYAVLGRSTGEVPTGPGSLAAATAVAIAMGLLLAAMRRWARPAVALAVTLVVALTTPVWSTGADLLLTHPVTILGLCLAIWGLPTGRPSYRALALGTGLGVAALARPHLLVVGLAVAVALAWQRRWRDLALSVPGLVAALAVLVWWNRMLLGTWTLNTYARPWSRLVPGAAPGPASAHHQSWLEQFAAYFLSPSRGLFLWTPLLLVVLIVAARRWRDRPLLVSALAVGGLGYAVAQLTSGLWSGGSGFYGYRQGLEPLICLAPLMAVELDRAGPLLRRLAAAVIGVQFAAIALGAPGPGQLHDPTQHLGAASQYAWLPNATWTMLGAHPLLWAVAAGLAVVGGWCAWWLLAPPSQAA